MSVIGHCNDDQSTVSNVVWSEHRPTESTDYCTARRSRDKFSTNSVGAFYCVICQQFSMKSQLRNRVDMC